MLRSPLLAAVLITTVGLSAGAQCADGAPPPCRGRTAAVAAARHVDPPLDDNTWIVLPFDNLAKSPEVEWLRDASVNLLYLDLSKWRDIRVVDDERVADLLRAMPEVETGKSLTLTAGLAVAKRAGAGRLVMGDLLRIGTKTTLTAKVFDVKGGQRIRTANQDALVLDSLMPAFGRLARGILNVAPPEGTNVGEIGTANTGAYQDYLEGVKALNRFDLKSARAHFDAALKQDSTFALAHYKLATLIGWENPADPTKVEHARAASRFSGPLPPRERALVAGLLAFNNLEYGRACTTYGSLIKADSTDADALYGMGECLYHDNVVEAIGGDTTRVRYRGSWNSAIRVFQRTLVLDPSFHLAFQHILDAYTADGRPGCRLKDVTALAAQSTAASCAAQYTTAVRRDGDSLLTVPVSIRNPARLAADQDEARKTNARLANIQRARDVVHAWVDAGPSEPRARSVLARIDLMLGDVVKADDDLSKVRIADLDDAERGRAVLARLELDWKLARDARFVHLTDSLAGTHPAGLAATYTPIALAVTGRLAAFDSLIATDFARGGAPPLVPAYFKSAARVAFGLTPTGAAVAESTLYATIAAAPPTRGGGRRSAVVAVGTTLMFGRALNRAAWAAIDSVTDPRLAPSRARAAGDTAALRAAAKRLDSIALAGQDRLADDGSVIIAADSYLILHDSAAALATLRFFFDHRLNVTPMFDAIANGVIFASFVWPRALLMRAELEAAVGDKAAARAAFSRVIALWAKADPEFQPMLERARRGLAAIP